MFIRGVCLCNILGNMLKKWVLTRVNPKACKRIIFLAFAVTFLCSAVYYITLQHKKQPTFQTVWGETVEPNELSLSLLNNKIMKRIKDVDQSGPARFFGPKLPKFTRFDHCIGVMSLIIRAHGTQKEQATALLHDTSHTVFSHVGDHLFTNKDTCEKYTTTSYQDSMHMQYIKEANLNKILEKFGLTEKDLDPEHLDYKALEQPLPDMCADRIEYNIHTGIILGIITKTAAKEIVENLRYENKLWFFTDPKLALKFAELSLYFTQNFWGAKWNTSMNIHLAAALRRALNIKLISYKDLYSTDSVIMHKLLKNQDKLIQTFIQQCQKPLETIMGKKYETINFAPKFRGIDPLIKDHKTGELKRLSEVDIIFKNHYDSVREWCEMGYEISALKGVY